MRIDPHHRTLPAAPSQASDDAGILARELRGEDRTRLGVIVPVPWLARAAPVFIGRETLDEDGRHRAVEIGGG